MRHLRHATNDFAWPSLHHGQGRLLGLPFVFAACAPGPVFGWPDTFAALMIASIASFLVYVPMTALALNHGAPLSDDAAIPQLTPRAYAVLLALWTATAWLAAAAVAHLHGTPAIA
jgi:hypothetical protein